MSLVIGVAGGSGSGKTTFARRLKDNFGERAQIIAQDSYYKDQSHKFDHDGGSVNFDHPSAIDFELLETHIFKLKKNKTIQVPVYEFSSHSRLKHTIEVPPTPLIIVDGILILADAQVRQALDYKLFISCPESLRYSRRLKRDVEERGRTPEGVKNQFDLQVKPMHDQFVGPSKSHADSIITQDIFETQLQVWTEKIQSFLPQA